MIATNPNAPGATDLYGRQRSATAPAPTRLARTGATMARTPMDVANHAAEYDEATMKGKPAPPMMRVSRVAQQPSNTPQASAAAAPRARAYGVSDDVGHWLAENNPFNAPDEKIPDATETAPIGAPQNVHVPADGGLPPFDPGAYGTYTPEQMAQFGGYSSDVQGLQGGLASGSMDFQDRAFSSDLPDRMLAQTQADIERNRLQDVGSQTASFSNAGIGPGSGLALEHRAALENQYNQQRVQSQLGAESLRNTMQLQALQNTGQAAGALSQQEIAGYNTLLTGQSAQADERLRAVDFNNSTQRFIDDFSTGRAKWLTETQLNVMFHNIANQMGTEQFNALLKERFNNAQSDVERAQLEALFQGYASQMGLYGGALESGGKIGAAAASGGSGAAAGRQGESAAPGTTYDTWQPYQGYQPEGPGLSYTPQRIGR